MIIKGSLQGQDILIMNVYHPPGHPPDTVTNMFMELAEMTADTVIVGGDFNCIMNPLIDRFPHSTNAPSRQANALRSICKDFGFEDVWRNLHPANKEYTFFSAPHGCQTRLDYFFLPKADMHSILSCDIGSIIISDHAAVVMDLKLKNPINQPRQWRLDSVILKDNTFISYFITEFKVFLSINLPSTDNPSLLWETCKAYARGLFISYTSTKRRQKRREQNNLAIELTDKEKAYINSPSPTLWEEISALKSAINCLLTKEAEKKMRYVKQRFYEHGDKPGKCLAYLAKKKQSPSP